MLIGDTIQLETIPSFYVVIRATRRSSHLQCTGSTWVLVRSRESKPRPPALQSRALPTELILPAVKRNLRNSLADNHSWINNQTDIFVVHLFISSAKEKFYPRKEYNPHHIGVSKQWNGGHVCSVKSFCYVNNFLLFQEICTSCRPSEWEGSISIFFRCCLDIKIFIVIFFFTSPVVVALLRVFILNITLLIPLRDLRSNKQTFWL